MGHPYHVIQRGNRNQRVFLVEGDERKYLSILKVQASLFDVEIWAYCLMLNHVHLIVMPKQGGSLTECISETHRSYTRMINFREDWRGHLWQGRFLSYPMDSRYLYAAVRYVERNPVRAGIVASAEDYIWSSAKVHVKHKIDDLLSHFYLMDEIKDWKTYLSASDREDDLKILRGNQTTGRPVGSDEFISNLEVLQGRPLAKQKTGPKTIKILGEGQLFSA